MGQSVSFDIINYKHQIEIDTLKGVSSHLIVINKANLDNPDFKEHILEIETRLKEDYSTSRMKMISEDHYILKVTTLTDEIPDGI